jgi:uncharacterized membrane protein
MLYSVLKFVHVVSIAVWFGALVTLFLLNRLFARANDYSTVQAIGRQGASLGTKLFLPSVVITLITGIGLVQIADYGFSATWVVWGIVGLIASMVIGGALTGRTARQLGARIAAGTIDAAGIAATQRKLVVFAVLNIVLLLSVIWAMVAKPS